MKKKLAILGAVAGVILAGLVVFLLSIDVNQYRGTVQAKLQKQVGRPVTLGEMGLRLLPLSLRVSDIRIGESPAFPTNRPFLTAKELRVRVGLLALVEKRVDVRSIVLLEPSIELVRNAAGAWNYADLAGGTATATSTDKSNAAISIASLEIRDGALAVSSLSAPAARSVYDHIDVKLVDYVPGKSFRLDAGARLPGSGRNSLTLEARGGPVGAAEPEITGRLGFRDASIAGLQRFLSAKPGIQIDGLLSGDADLRAAKSMIGVKGMIEMRKAVIDGRAVEYPLILDYDVTDDTRSGLMKLANVKLSVGNVPIFATGEMNTKASTIDVQVRVPRSSLAEVLSVAGTFGGEPLSGTGAVSLDVRAQGSLETKDGLLYSGNGAVENAVINMPSLTKPFQVRSANLKFDKDAARLENLACSLGGSTLRGVMTVRNFRTPDIGFGLQVDKLDLAELQQLTNTPGAKPSSSQPASTGAMSAKGTVDIGSILYNGLVLNKVHSDCTLSRGVLSLAPLTAEVYGGRQTGSLTLDTRARPPALAMNTKFENVDANQLLSATTAVKKTLYGLLAAQGDARMTLAPGAAAAQTLNGKLGLKLTQGKLTGVNLLSQVAALGKFVGYAPKNDAYTEIVQLAGDMVVKDGIAETDNLRLQLSGGTMAAAGTINLANQALNLKVTTVLDRAMSQKVGGTGIGGFLSTALANDKGELVIPAIVTGTFAQPRFAPDTARVADMKLKSLLPTSGNPGAPTSGILGALKGIAGGQRPQAPGAAASKPGGIDASKLLGGVLESLGKKKETRQPKQ